MARDRYIAVPAQELAGALGGAGVSEVEAALRGIYRAEFHTAADALGDLSLSAAPHAGDPDAPVSDSEREFVDGVEELLRAARYVPVSRRDVEAAHAINGRDYLTQVVIRADPKALSSQLLAAGRGQASLTAFPAEVAPKDAPDVTAEEESMLDADDMQLYGRVQVWRKGYRVEKRRGRLLLEKLDYLQSKSWTKVLGLQASDKAGRRLLARALNKTEELARAEGWLPEVSERAGTVLQELGEGDEPQEGHSAPRPPRFVEAVSCSEAFEGVLKRPPTAPGGLFGASELAEPLLGSVFLLYLAAPPRAPNPLKAFLKRVAEQSSVLTEKGLVLGTGDAGVSVGGAGGGGGEGGEATGPGLGRATPREEASGEDSRLKVDAFADLPWSGIRLVFPERRLAFRPVELVRLDLLSFLSLLGLASRWKFVASAPSTLDPEVLLHDAYINILALVAAGVVVGRLVLSWRRAFNIYELKLARLANERRTTAQGAALQQLAREAAAERTKEVLLAWAALREAGTPLAPTALRAASEALLRETCALGVNGADIPEGGAGPGPALDDRTAAELVRLGLAWEEEEEEEEGGEAPGARRAGGARVSARPPAAALAALRDHWARLFASS